MPQILLHIPAWWHTTEGDKDARAIHVRLEHLPRERDQIEVPGGGIVEVSCVRHRPLWTDDDPIEGLPLGYAYSENTPEVFTDWVARPEGAPKTRMPGGGRG